MSTKKIKKGLSGRVKAGIVCIIVAILIAFVVSPIFTGLIGSKTEVIRVTRTIKVGEEFTTENIETVEMSRYNLPDTIVKDSKTVLGKSTNSTLVKGDTIIKEKVIDKTSDGNYLYNLKNGEQAISVAIKDFASGLSAKIQPGDIVQVMGNGTITNDRAAVYPELKYVRVLAVTSPSGLDYSGEIATEENQLPTTVTFLCNQEQASLVTGLSEQNGVHLSLVFRGDDSEANKFLEEQRRFFTTNIAM